MSDSREESICVLVFNGKKADWPAWEEKFLAKATRKGIKTILVDDTIVIPKSNEVLDESVESDQKKLAIRQMNDQAYSELILSIDTTQSVGKGCVQYCKGLQEYRLQRREREQSVERVDSKIPTEHSTE